MRCFGLALVVSVAACLAGCGESDALGPKPSSNRIVVGVVSDLEPGVEIARLRVSTHADGALLSERVLRVGTGGADELVMPHEVAFPDLPYGTRVAVRLEAYETMQSDEAPLIVREAETVIAPGGPKLLRARLERECIPNYQLGGTAVTPTCSAPDTCIAAACTTPFVPPERLEDYRADWALDFADSCKPAEAGDPTIEIGEGREAFRSLVGDDVMQLGAGFQGGYHVWVAVRMKNLHQAGSVTEVEGDIVDPAAAFDPLALAYGYEPTGDGSCDVVGIRFEVPEQYWNVVTPLLGATIHIRAKVIDVAGDVGLDEVTARISEDFIKDVTD